MRSRGGAHARERGLEGAQHLVGPAARGLELLPDVAPPERRVRLVRGEGRGVSD